MNQIKDSAIALQLKELKTLYQDLAIKKSKENPPNTEQLIEIEEMLETLNYLANKL